MGRIYDEAPDHEGYMEREVVSGMNGDRSYLVHHDESSGSWWVSAWAQGIPAPTGRWRSACSCGWTGPIVEAGEVVAVDGDHDPVSEFLDETVEDLLMGAWDQHVGGFLALGLVADAATASRTALRQLDDAVAGAVAAERSWDEIAGAAGVSRQEAQARWSTGG